MGAFINRVNFSNAVLVGTDFRNSVMIDSQLNNVDLSQADLRGSNLTFTNLTGVNLTEAILRGSDLSGARLENAILTDAGLLGVNWELARFNDQTVWPENFDELNQNMMGPGVNLRGYRFPIGFDASGVQLTGADLSGVYLEGVNLSGAQLQNLEGQLPNYNGALINVDLSYADLSGTRIHVNSSANLDSSINFNYADLTDGGLSIGNTSGHSFVGTDFTRCELGGAFDGSSLETAESLEDLSASLSYRSMTRQH